MWRREPIEIGPLAANQHLRRGALDRIGAASVESPVMLTDR
jgi:hypothetical protein